MSDRDSKAGSFNEEAGPTETEEISLSYPTDNVRDVPEKQPQKPQQSFERVYLNAPVQPPSNEPKNVKINLYDRDPTHMNEIVKVQFDDIFAEPEGAYSIDGVWTTSHTVFTGTKHWCYRILSAIFAVPCSFCWGIHFACLAFNYIWTIQPSFRSFNIQLRPLAKIWGMCVRSFCDPFFQSLALILSKIRISFKKDQKD